MVASPASTPSRAGQQRAERFDIVITDLGMPHVDGRKVAAAIKRLSKATPIIFLTGWGQRLIAANEVPEHVDRVLQQAAAAMRNCALRSRNSCHEPGNGTFADRG